METQIRSGLLLYSYRRFVHRCPSAGEQHVDRPPKLRNPNALSFTHVELQQAMLETIASFNQFAEEAGVGLVRWLDDFPPSDLTDQCLSPA